MEKIDWNILSKNDIEQKNDPLKNYILINRHNLNDLKIGMHIKYIKNEIKTETGEMIEKVKNGGFLVNIKNGKKVYEMILVVKTNIIWNLKFIKYKIYGQTQRLNLESKLIKKINLNGFKDLFIDLITERKKELENEQNEKIKDIISKKNDYNIIL